PAYFDTFPLGDSDGTILSAGCAYPKIRSATSAFGGGRYAPHIAEGIDLGAENELHCLAAPIGQLVTHQTTILPRVGLDARDVATIKSAGARLVWAPRSNVDLYGNTAPVTEFFRAGVPIALGTDWLASGSMNLLRELRCADALNAKYFHATFADRDL